MKIDDLYLRFKQCSSVSTDTRKLTKHCMYFALKGDNFDGNKFVSQALDGGSKYCVVDDASAVLNDNCILVDDVLKSLQQLATYHRNKIKVPIIALTGSNGKTTTKELIATVLSTTYNVKATQGNLNNHIGVPLTLLSFTQNLDYGIVEMGANHQKEIQFLAELAQPDYGLITNFGKAHLEGFGGVEGIIKGKSELYDFIKANNKWAFINADDEKQVKQIGDYENIISFGSNDGCDFTVDFLDAKPYVTLRFDDTVINSQLIGNYNYSNMAVAVAIGRYFNVSRDNIKYAIESFRPDNNRSEIIEKGTMNIILDAYNANPTSMIAAITNFKQLDAKRKFLFLGDMFELGDEAKQEHQAITNLVQDNFNENIYLIGENFFETNSTTGVNKYASFEDLKHTLSSLELEGSTILIKGSRGMALERILDLI